MAKSLSIKKQCCKAAW